MKIKVGIAGAGGYTAGELIRLLLHHPHVVLTQLQSESQAGKAISTVHTDLVGETDLLFSGDMIDDEVDVIFLCKGHGQSIRFLADHPNLLNKKIIDLSQDHRLKGAHDFVYGLPELHREKILVAHHLANPGCFATAIQLALLPACKQDLIKSDIHLSGITGSTGAGQEFTLTSHYSWRHGNASVYKPLTHQHLHEIGETIQRLQPDFRQNVRFIPYRGAFTRGIIITAYFEYAGNTDSLRQIYQDFYTGHPFTHMTSQNPDVKQVVNTNKCLVYPSVIDGQAVVVSVIDNLLKGASGQAVQNMNLMFGLDETTGLLLKASIF